MDVTRLNFPLALHAFRALLPSAAFISLDLEFTGLGAITSPLDTPAVRYESARGYATVFPPVQLGCVLFMHVGGAWEACPFNFNLCPRPIWSGRGRYPVRDVVFSMQGSSVEFLVSHGFDFGRCLAEGVGWCDESGERLLRSMASAAAPTAGRKEVEKSNVGAEDAAAIDDVRACLKEWVGKTEVGGVKVLKMFSEPLRRRLVYEMLAREFGRCAANAVVGQDGKRSLRLVIMPTVEEAARANEEVKERERKEALERHVAESVGFRYVIDAIVAAGKPLIVHHGFLDMTKVVGNFLGPMPEGLAEFKAVMQKSFPCLIDTRMLLLHAEKSHPWLTALRRNSTAKDLSGIVKALEERSAGGKLTGISLSFCPEDVAQRFENEAIEELRRSKVFKYNSRKDSRHSGGHEPQLSFHRYSGPWFAHEAGYDALQTGRLFLFLINLIHGSEWAPDQPDASSAVANLPAVAPIVNQIFLGACGGYTHVDLARGGGHDKSFPEDEPNAYFDRESVLVVSGITVDAASDKIPFAKCLAIAEDLLQGTRFDSKQSQTIAADGGSFLLILNRGKGKLDGSALRNGVTAEAPLPVTGNTETEVESEDLEALHSSIAEDLQKVRQAALSRGLHVMTYHEALTAQRRPKKRARVAEPVLNFPHS